MKRQNGFRRRALAMALGLGLPLVVIAACGFPDVTFDDQRNANTPLGSPSGDPVPPSKRYPTDSGWFDDEGKFIPYSPPPFDAEDAYARRDGGNVILDPSVCSQRIPCDCDDDGFAALDCAVDPATIDSSRGQPLLPGDCDDLDPLRFPGQTWLGIPPIPGRNGDWNCDGIEEHMYAIPQCQGTPATGCSADRGFSGDVPCGAPGVLLSCVPGPYVDATSRECVAGADAQQEMIAAPCR